MRLLVVPLNAPVAQLDRASGFEPEGREFESLRARHYDAGLPRLVQSRNRVCLSASKNSRTSTRRQSPS